MRVVLGGGGAGLMTVREVAARLAVHPATVYALCGCGELVHLRISNAIRVAPQDLEVFIVQRRHGPQMRPGETR